MTALFTFFAARNPFNYLLNFIMLICALVIVVLLVKWLLSKIPVPTVLLYVAAILAFMGLLWLIFGPMSILSYSWF